VARLAAGRTLIAFGVSTRESRNLATVFDPRPPQPGPNCAAGAAEDLKPCTSIHLTFLVDDIHDHERHLPTVGAEILEAEKPVPTGWNMLVRHPDDTVVEYVQHGHH
jgi:predicted enzyme related to lactoylglutathione lyase